MDGDSVAKLFNLGFALLGVGGAGRCLGSAVPGRADGDDDILIWELDELELDYFSGGGSKLPATDAVGDVGSKPGGVWRSQR